MRPARRLLFATLTAALGLLGAELAVRAALRAPAVQQALFYRYGPASFRLAWLYDDHDEALFSRWFRPDPEVGWVPAPGAFEDDGLTRTVDADGRRRTPAGGPVVAQLFGDSFTFGDDADDVDTWAWQLAERRPDLTVHDHGVSGHGLGQAVTLARRAPPADVRVLGLNRLLVLRTAYDFYTFAKPRWTLDDGALVASAPPVEAPAALRARLTWSPRLRDLVDMAAWREDDDATAAVALALLDRFARDAEAAGARPVVLLLPTPSEVRETTPILPWVRPWCQARPGTCVDLAPSFRALAAEGVPLEHKAHWTRAGHGVVAIAAASVLPRR